ncbi:MAG: O-antigen ligase family protein [Bacteroidota bacterium]
MIRHIQQVFHARSPWEKAYLVLLLLTVVSLVSSRAGLSIATGLFFIAAFVGSGRHTNYYLILFLLPLWWLSTGVGLLQSPDLIRGLDMWLLGVPFLSFTLAIVRMKPLDQAGARLIFDVFLWALIAAWCLAMGIGGYRWILGELSWDRAFTYANFTENILQHPTYLAFMLNVGIIWLIQQYDLKGHHLYAFGFLLLFLLMTAARLQIFIGLAILVGVLFFKYPTWRKWLLSGLIMMLVLASLAVSFLPQETQRMQDLWTYQEIENIRHNGVAVRLALWEITWGEIMAHPVTGVGVGNVQPTLEAAFIREGLPLQGLGPHNQYLHTALAVGIPSMCVLIFVLGLPLIVALRQKRYTAACILLIFILGCLTEDILSRQIGICTLAFFLPLTWTMKYSNQVEEKESRPS